MRIIDLTDNKNIEIWPGRRLFTGAALISLPRSAASYRKGSSRSELLFGTSTRTTMQVLGPDNVISVLWDHIVSSERPEKAIHV